MVGVRQTASPGHVAAMAVSGLAEHASLQPSARQVACAARRAVLGNAEAHPMGAEGRAPQRVVRDSLVTQVPAVRRAVLGNAEAHPTGAEGRVLQYVVLECPAIWGCAVRRAAPVGLAVTMVVAVHAERVLMAVCPTGRVVRRAALGNVEADPTDVEVPAPQRAHLDRRATRRRAVPRPAAVSAASRPVAERRVLALPATSVRMEPALMARGAMFATMASTIAAILVDSIVITWEFYIDKE